MKRLLILLMALLLVSCDGNNTIDNANTETLNNQSNPVADNEPSEASQETTETVFTKSSLSEFNGKDGKAAYIAIEGVVYDVSDEPMWMNGIHQGRFEAGQDLTEEMKNAPHGFSKLGQLNKVGIYED